MKNDENFQSYVSIISKIKAGWKDRQIIKFTKISKEKLLDIQLEFLNIHAPFNNKQNFVLGVKDESYYTESELMAGIEEYTYESLSKQEKEIYDKICS